MKVTYEVSQEVVVELTATSATKTSEGVMLLVTEDQAEALLALTGNCNSNDYRHQVGTMSVYHALMAVSPQEAENKFLSKYEVRDERGEKIGSLHLVRRKGMED